MGQLKAKYRGGTLEYRITSTGERIPLAPLVFYDDFLGFELAKTESGSTGIWSTVEVLLNAPIALAANVANGVVSMALDSDVNAEDAVLYWGNQRVINVKAAAVVEFRARVPVLPTLTAQIVMGLAGAHNLDKDAVTEHAWFKWDGSGVVVLESDDTTNDEDDIASGITTLITDYNIFRIDFTDLADVKFYIDGNRVGSATTFDMSNLTDAEALMQPYLSLDKGADAGLGTLLPDYVKIWSKRTE